MAQLEWVAGPAPVPGWQRFPLDDGVRRLGRAGDCAPKLADPRASRRHAELRVTTPPDGPCVAVLTDLGSANGTFHNGRRLPTGRGVVLADGDMLVVGDTALRFSAVDREAPRPPDAGGETVVRFLAPDERPALVDGGGDRDQVGALRLLLDLAREIESAETVDDMERRLAEPLRRALRADRVALRTFPPLERAVEGEWPTEGVGAEALRRARTETAAVLVHETAVRRVRQMARDATLPPDAPHTASDAPVESAVAVPLLADGALLGILYAERRRHTVTRGTLSMPLGGADLELATAAGWQCALALLKLSRFAGLRAARDRLEADLGQSQGLLGDTPAMDAVRSFIHRAGPSDAGVLILGESGTGKELVARALHRASPRRERPFVTVNAAALPEALAEAELFGHTKGAFTGADAAREGWFAAAHGGTLFLDEIGELPPAVQAKLLRVLESGEMTPVGAGARTRRVDVRVLAATHRDLEAAAAQQRFRQDLYYRLNILRIDLPPLRDRLRDLPLLAAHFTRLISQQTGRAPKSWTPRAMQALLAHDWPGNVRELKNTVERAVILSVGPELDLDDLPHPLVDAPPEPDPGPPTVVLPPDAPTSTENEDAPPLTLAAMEQRHIEHVLRRVGGNKSRAAALLGIDRSTLYAKLRTLPSGDGDTSSDFPEER